MDSRQLAAIAVAILIMGIWFMTLPSGEMTQGVTRPDPGVRGMPDALTHDSVTQDSVTQDAPLRHSAEDGEGGRTVRAGEPIQPAGAAPSSAGEPPSPRAALDDAPGREFVLENDAVRLRVDSRGAVLRSVELLRYQDRIGEGARPVQLVTLPARGAAVLSITGARLEGVERLPHELLEHGSRRVRLRREQGGVELLREVELDAEGYGAWLRTTILNRADQPIRPKIELDFYAQGQAQGGEDGFQNYSGIGSIAGETQRVAILGIDSGSFFGSLFGGAPGEPVEYPAPVEWAGLDSQYFLAAALPEDPAKAFGFAAPIGRDAGVVALRYPPFEIPPGHKLERSYRLYLGPKTRPDVASVDPRLDVALDVGWSWVRPLVHLFDSALLWTYRNVVANYGVAIILLTIVLRLVTYPLTQKSMKSMKRFGEIAPEMKAIQEQYQDDREKMQAELMSLYRQKGMNPFTAMGGGCLPMLIQMPFLLALYFALQGSIELRHAPFVLWIQDLSTPENFAALFGVPIRPLPLLMGGSMILQQWLTPSTADAQQKQMMMWMSLVFTFMFYQFPSGLVLYWFVSNLLGILQQILVNRGGPAPVAASSA